MVRFMKWGLKPEMMLRKGYLYILVRFWVM
jgi:hypothetical protein